ncbi:VOC family protein [Microbacterium kribbense]|uniref:VOC family protein n=1 Tax=Microbacterium kribbense TaxID=433645 RepID=A0ABP7G4F2_9MICO
MATNIFVNLPTNDLERSKAFYAALGTSLNPQFTDDNAACIVWDDNVFFMVLRREFFATFTDKPIGDPAVSVQASTAFSCDSREEVDRIIEAGLAAGGAEPRPAQDLGFMYSRDLDDPDGNSLGFLYMAPEAVEVGPEAYMDDHGQDVA